MDIEHKLLAIFVKNTVPLNLKAKTLQPSNYFHLKPDYKQEYIHSKLLSLKESFLLACGIESFEPVNYQSVTPFFTYGMISSPTGTKIEDIIYLFNSTDDSNVPIKLDLSALSSYSFFNGQIVALYGSNSQGMSFLVEKLFYLPVLTTNFLGTEKKQLINLEVSKGPYNVETIDKIFKAQSSLYVFMGPFFEYNSNSFNSLEEFTNCLDKHIEKQPNSKAIIVPATADYSAIKIFPQPSLPTASKSILSYPNPCSFYANNHLITICNFDNLMDIAFEEKAKKDDKCTEEIFKKDRMNRLVHHLVYQQSFVPVLTSLSEVAYGTWLDIDVAPDLYIISSKMKFTNNKIGPSTVLNATHRNLYSIRSEASTETYKIDMEIMPTL